ncbi:PHP domain-containing protein [Fontimonas sp. SYSU GA230001]|uniref:PHP domain-containing protein n=1 Tax=Fontimonas sp. SYSU GA230001 TaxID=3142450 RepID=UPI0032B4E921
MVEATARAGSTVDLHAHSTASDGELTPAALVARAAGAGVRMLALTDHDSVAGIEAAQQEARRHGLHLVPGVELSVTWERRTLHLVGLGIDPTARALHDGLALLQQRRAARARAVAAKIERLGVADALARAEALAAGGQITRSHFARLLIDAGICRDAKRAFRRYLANGKAAYVATQWAELDQALDWIKSAGGLAVLAHPRRYTLGTSARGRLLAQFRALGGDGIEVCCGNSAAAEIQSSAREAREHGLAGSVASDFHGCLQPWNRLGGVAALPDGIAPIAEHLDA